MARSGQHLQTPPSLTLLYANEGTVGEIRIRPRENPSLIELSPCNFLPSELAAKLGQRKRCVFKCELCGGVKPCWQHRDKVKMGIQCLQLHKLLHV